MKKTILLFNEMNCSGCHACEVACKQEHGLGVGPRLIRGIERAPFFMPLYCHHCEDAPCVVACWENAITIDPGTKVVLHHNELCNGCLAVPGTSGTEKQDTSPCMVDCPANNNVQGFVSLVGKGNYRRAIQVIKETSPFPSVCGRVCPHPCETSCNRDQIDEPLAIRSIERFIADWDRTSDSPYMPNIKEAREETIAIVGSGPAGLTAAYFLARLGYKVTVFEKLPVVGGMMAVGIPEYRLPKDVLAADIQHIRDVGVDIQTEVTFGTDITLESLRQEGFHAVFLATGLHKNSRLDLEDEDVEGVLRGIDFLRDVSMGNSVTVGEKVLVVGGGNVAMDVAMTALRTGGKEVSLVCLECREDMPAWEREIQMAVEEGVEIINCMGPHQFLTENGRFAGIEFMSCTSVFDEDGVFNPTYDETDLLTLEGDTAIVAIGQVADLTFIEDVGIPVTVNGCFQADPVSLETAIEGVFVGGDVYSGPASIADAIGSGKQAAISIDRYIKGWDLRIGRLGQDKTWKVITNPQMKIFDSAARSHVPTLDHQERIRTFDEIQIGFTENMALQEANRCLMCGASCVQACPYDVMQFDHTTYKAVKCDLCMDRRARGEAPACSTICHTRCIYWGDPEDVPEGIEIVL